MSDAIAPDQAVLDAAWAWAESTRVYAPAGDTDAENHLLECAQSLFNAHPNGPPLRASALTADERAALEWLASDLRATICAEDRTLRWNDEAWKALGVLHRLLATDEGAR